MDANEFYIILLTFLDSFCAGLVVPVVAPYIVKNGANQLILGLLASITFTSRLLSPPVHNNVIRFSFWSKKIEILWSLFITFLTYFLLAIFKSYWIIIISRCIYGLLTRTDDLCKQSLRSSEQSNYALNLIGIFQIAGIVIGPILGGHLYDISSHSYCMLNAVIACCLTVFNIVLAYKKIHWQSASSVKTISQEYYYYRKCWQQLIELICFTSSRQYIHIVGLNVAYAFFSLLFFTKFTFLLAEHYAFTATLIGYTIAYQNIILFGATCLIGLFVNQDQTREPPKKLMGQFQIANVVYACCLLGVCFTLNYDYYLLLFVVLALSRAFIEHFWIKFPIINEYFPVVDACTSVSAPVFFGYFVLRFGIEAFQMFYLLPLIVTVFIVHEWYFCKNLSFENVNEKNV